VPEALSATEVGSKISEHLAVDVYLLLVQRGDQPRVGSAVHPGRRIDAGDPELTECPLLGSSVTVGILHRLVDVMLCHRVDLASRTPVAFRLAENPLATAVGGNFAL